MTRTARIASPWNMSGNVCTYARLACDIVPDMPHPQSFCVCMRKHQKIIPKQWKKRDEFKKSNSWHLIRRIALWSTLWILFRLHHHPAFHLFSSNVSLRTQNYHTVLCFLEWKTEQGAKKWIYYKGRNISWEDNRVKSTSLRCSDVETLCGKAPYTGMMRNVGFILLLLDLLLVQVIWGRVISCL